MKKVTSLKRRTTTKFSALLLATTIVFSACQKNDGGNDNAPTDTQIAIDAQKAAVGIENNETIVPNAARYDFNPLNFPQQTTPVSFTSNPILLKLRQYFAQYYAQLNPIDSIQVDRNTRTQVAAYYAEGFQIYEVRRNATTNVIEWAFVAPFAKLYNNGAFVGTHFGGPTWKANDSSAVVGMLVKSSPSRIQPTFNIPWLLISNRSNTGNGIFSNVVNVQRLGTIGGQRRNSQFLTEANLGRRDSVPYSTLYTFWKLK